MVDFLDRQPFADMSHHVPRPPNPTFSARKRSDVGSGPARRGLSAALPLLAVGTRRLRGAVAGWRRSPFPS